MQYIIYGAGGIGGGIGALLFEQDRDVSLIARGAHLDRLRKQGLTLRTPDHEATLQIPSVGHPSEIGIGEDDVVILAMKSQDTFAALHELRQAAGDVVVICAQNGVANEQMASRLFTRVYGMLVYMPATHLEPGMVLLHAAPTRGSLDAGRFPGGTDPLIEQVCKHLSEAGFRSQPQAQIMRYKYAKLLLNLGNGVQALAGYEADMKAITRTLRKEAMQCYEAAGIDFVTARELVDKFKNRWQRGTIDGEERQGGSSWQSLARGLRSVEVDYLNGEIALLGALHGVATPYNRTVQRLAARAATEGKPPGSVTVDEIIAMAEKEPEY